MQERDWEKGYLTDTCLSKQNTFKNTWIISKYRMKIEKLTHGLFKAVREFSVIYRLCENDKIALAVSLYQVIVCA